MPPAYKSPEEARNALISALPYGKETTLNTWRDINALSAAVPNTVSPKAVEPTTLTSTNPDGKNATNTAKITNYPQSGQQMGADGVPRNADGSLPQTYNGEGGARMNADGSPVSAPEGALQSANGLWYSNGQAYAAPPGGSKILTPDEQWAADQDAELERQKSQADATTAALLENIKSQFAGYRAQQESANRGANAGVFSLLQRGGSLQTASSEGIIQSQMTAGLQAMSDLSAKENSAVIAAKQAHEDLDFKILDRQLTIAAEARKERAAKAKEINDALIKAKEDAQTKQATADKAQAAIQSDINNLAESAAKNGASPETVQAIANSKDMASAFVAAGTSLSTAKALATGTSPSGGTTGVIDSLPLPTVTLTGTGAPDATSQAAFLKTLPPDVQIYVKGMADYSIAPTTSAQKQYRGVSGLSQQDALTLVRRYDPTYQESQYATRAAMQKNITSGTYSQSIASANTVIHHLESLKQTADALGNGQLSFFNAGKNFFQTAGGSALQNNFNIMADAVASEMAKVYKTGVPAHEEITSWRNNLNASMSPAQFEGAVQTMVSLLGGRLATLSDNYQGVMGKPLSSFAGGFQILTPSSAAALQNLGLDPSEVDPTYGQSTTYQGIDLSGSASTQPANYNGINLPN